MSGEADNSNPRLEIGGTLWRVRERRGLSLQQVEEATKIQSGYLRDLENENFEALPTGRVRDYLEIYAEYLGLDGAVLIAEFRCRQDLAQPEREVAGEASQAGQPRRLVAPLAHPFGEDDTVENEVVLLPRRNSRLYVTFAAVLAFLLLATTLAWSLEGEGWAFISQMRGTDDPQVSSAGTHFGNAEDAKGDTGESQPGDQAEPPAADASMGRGDTAGQGGQETSWAAQASPSASALASPPTSASVSAPASSSATAAASASPTASASASASASAEAPATTAPALESTPATSTPAPASVSPNSAAQRGTAGGEGGTASVPTGWTVRIVTVTPVQQPQPTSSGAKRPGGE